MREELINPGKVKLHEGWDSYVKNIEQAGKFHIDLAGKYHSQTFSFYGDGKDPDTGLTWGTVDWLALMAYPKLDPGAAELLGLRPLMDDGVGQVSAVSGERRYQFYMAPKDSAGEGTVPVRSGSAVTAGSQATYCLDLSGVGHEGAYRSDMDQQVTLHAILQIAQTANVLS